MSKHRNGSVINAKKGKLRAIAYLSEDGSIYEADKKENKRNTRITNTKKIE